MIELKQFFRERDSVVFTFLFPVILLAIFGSVFNDEIAPGVSFTQYFGRGDDRRPGSCCPASRRCRSGSRWNVTTAH